MAKGRKMRAATAEIIRDPRSKVEVSAHGADGPTAERRAQGKFERVDVYEGKQARRVLRAVDTLGALLIAQKITQPQHAAGCRFRDAFARAHLDPLRAADLGRSGGRGQGEETAKVAAARVLVRAMLSQLGGAGTPIGQAAWWVIGAGNSYSDFARRQRWGRAGSMDRKTAVALTIGALAVWGGDGAGDRR